MRGLVYDVRQFGLYLEAMREQLKSSEEKVIQWDLHCRKLTCWNLETKMGVGSKCGVKKDAAFSQWHLPLGTTFVWKLTKKPPLGTDPPWTWQTWGFSSQLEAITIRDAWWTPWACGFLTHTSFPVVCSWEVQVPLQQGCLPSELSSSDEKVALIQARTALCSGPSLIWSSHSDQWVAYVA